VLSDLLVEDKFYHIMLYLVHLDMSRIQTDNFSSVRYTDCTGSCKSIYDTIATTTAPQEFLQPM